MPIHPRSIDFAHLSTCEVLRPFDGDEGRYQIGQIVDARPWRNAEALINRRYIAPVLLSRSAAPGRPPARPKD